jgi:hypothetical protein
LIVVPREACIRLDEWFKKQTDDNLKESFYSGAGAVGITRVDAAGKLVRDGDGNIVKDKADGVAADLFIRLKVCENGKTPAFASGPFDALDAVEPSRLRDGYELKLFPRRKPLASPTQIWTDDKDLLNETIFSSWTRMTERIDLPGSKNDGALKGLAEHMDGQDTSFVFLARILMPAAQAANARPERVAGDVLVDNHIRPFVYTAGALFQLMKP